MQRESFAAARESTTSMSCRPDSVSGHGASRLQAGFFRAQRLDLRCQRVLGEVRHWCGTFQHNIGRSGRFSNPCIFTIVAHMDEPPAAARVRPGTFAALAYPNYRLWFFGQMTSLFGTWMQSTAQGYLVYPADPFGGVPRVRRVRLRHRRVDLPPVRRRRRGPDPAAQPPGRHADPEHAPGPDPGRAHVPRASSSPGTSSCSPSPWVSSMPSMPRRASPSCWRWWSGPCSPTPLP